MYFFSDHKYWGLMYFIIQTKTIQKSWLNYTRVLKQWDLNDESYNLNKEIRVSILMSSYMSLLTFAFETHKKEFAVRMFLFCRWTSPFKFLHFLWHLNATVIPLTPTSLVTWCVTSDKNVTQTVTQMWTTHVITGSPWAPEPLFFPHHSLKGARWRLGVAVVRYCTTNTPEKYGLRKTVLGVNFLAVSFS